MIIICKHCGKEFETHDRRRRYCKKECADEAHCKQNRQAAHRYYQKNREKYLEQERIWRSQNPEKKSESNRRWYYANIEKKREQARQWKKNNREKVREYARRWRAANREKVYLQAKKWRWNHANLQQGRTDS